MKYLITLALALSLVGIAKAETLPESLLSCDSNFFSTLYKQRASFNKIMPLSIDKARHAWFSNKNNSQETWFIHPVQVGQLTLSGYWQENSDLKDLGKYYFWGLIIDESPDIVIATLSGVNWKKAGDEYFANTMIKQIGDREWQINTGAASGIAPSKGSLEKLLILDEYKGKSRLLCSLQGSVTQADLLPLRPDLADKK
nr:hypothetical protein [Pantoea sp. 201603H]